MDIIGWLKNKVTDENIEITNSKTVTFGRLNALGIKSDHHIRDDRKVSKQHCMVQGFLNVAFIHDLESKNGTFVNGRKVEDHIQLEDGDRVIMGITPFTYYRRTTENINKIKH